MHKKFEINRTKIKGGCQSGKKVVPHDSRSDLPLVVNSYLQFHRQAVLDEGLHQMSTFRVLGWVLGVGYAAESMG